MAYAGKKHKKVLVVLLLITTLLSSLPGLIGIGSSRVLADNHGCYADSKGTPSQAPCSPSIKDTNGNFLSPDTNCYLVAVQTLPPGVAGPPATTYTEVQCNDLTTPVPAGSNCGQTSSSGLSDSSNSSDYVKPDCVKPCGASNDQSVGNSLCVGTCEQGSNTTYQPSNGCGLVQRYIDPLVKVLSAGIGILVTIMIVIGGIQYSSAGGDPQKVAKAKSRIFNALFALLAYALLLGVLNFLIPGGVL